MNRLQATIIEYDPAIKQELKNRGYKPEQAEPCPQLNEKVLFIRYFPIDMLTMTPEFVVDTRLKAFICWYDNGEEEIRIVNNEYKDFLLSELYEVRKGTYDVIEEDI